MQLITKFKSSIVWQSVLPVPVVFVLGLLGLWLTLPGFIAENARENAVMSAKQTVGQFKTIRGYYTKNVVKKVLQSGAIKPSFDHEGKPGVIPLPATLIHDLSKLLKKEDTTIKLYSAYPFPNRSDRVLDPFQSEAWEFLAKNPDEVFVKQQKKGDTEVVRVAIADKMVAQGCVSCHNSHPTSPKTDWKLGDVRGVLEVQTSITPQLAAGAALNSKILMIVAFGGAVLLLISVFASRKISVPLLRVTRVMKKLAGGDMQVDIPDRDRQDEIGAISEAVQVFKESMVENERLQVERIEADTKAQEESRRAMLELADRFERDVGSSIEAVSVSARDMTDQVQTMARIANDTSKQSTAANQASEEASVKVQAVAAATNELSASTDEISRQVTESANVAQNALNEMTDTNAKVSNLADAGQKIAEVIDLINEIASQTNLLALNATIEAARAGDMGKGFAVVATEVKTLAEQTAKATDEIALQVTHMQTASESAVQAIGSIGSTIGKVDEIATAIASAVEEQGVATREIAANIEMAASETETVSSNVSGMATATTEAETAASMAVSTAGDLTTESKNLRVAVDEFLHHIRAA